MSDFTYLTNGLRVLAVSPDGDGGSVLNANFALLDAFMGTVIASGSAQTLESVLTLGDNANGLAIALDDNSSIQSDGDGNVTFTGTSFSGLTGYALISSLADVATSGAYSDLTGTPDFSGYALTSDLADVATSGLYSDLSGIPSFAAVATSGLYSDISGTPSLATVATTGAYSNLSGRPSLATVATSGAYGDLSGTPSLATVATTGAYDDLTGKPTLGTGTVTAISVATANGVSGSSSGGATPALTISLGAITPSSVVSTGKVSGKQFIANDTATISAGTGAGTSPTTSASILSNSCGQIILTTGTSPAASSTVVSVTYNTAYSTGNGVTNGAIVTLTPNNAAAAALFGTSAVYVSGLGRTQFDVVSGTTHLVAATQYIWNYHVVGC